jgi:PAS domain S-box-containing protein
MSATPSRELRWTIAVIATVAAVGALVEFPESFARTPFLATGAAAALVLLFGGMAGIIATQVITILATIYLVIPPIHSFAIAEFGDIARLAIFVGLFATADLLSWRLELSRAAAAERERSVRESEVRYRLILEQASDGIVVVAPEGRIVLANSRIAEMLGYTGEELLRLPLERVYAPGELERVPMGWEELMREPVVVRERRLIRKDGSTFMAELSVRRTSDNMAQAIVRDISVRHAAETAIRSERDLLEGILATSVAGIAVVTPEGRVVFLNSRAEALLGVTRADLPDWFAPRQEWRFVDRRGGPLPDEQRPVRRVIRRDEPVQDARLIVERPDGTRRILSINGAPLRGAARDVTGVVLSISDITEAEAAQKALRDREEQLERVTSAVPGVVYQYVVGPDGAGRFAFVSRRAEELLGASAEAILADSTRAWATMEPDDREAMQADFVRATRTLAPRSFDFQARGPGGSMRWLRDLATAAPSRDPGWVVWSGVIVDITERRRLEEELLQSQKMESIGRLAGGVAHDFNNLLTLVHGYAELLAKDLEESDPRLGPVNEIRHASDRAIGLTRQLLALSRRQVLTLIEVNVDTLLLDMERILRRVLGHDIIVETVAGARAGLVRADPSQLEQVLLNLAVNARDAMPGGGTLTLETRRTSLSVQHTGPDGRGVPPGDYVELRVTDTGIGMPRETQNMIFEPFFTTKPAGQGTGLGLATVHGIVHQSNGFITVESESGKGTSFRIFLPRLPDSVETPAPAPAPPREERHRLPPGMTVLVVEDDDGVRQLTRRVLDQYGYGVVEARSGAEALELLGKGGAEVGAVVSDVMMPGMSGRELVAQVRERWPVLPVLLLSGYAGVDLGEAGLRGPHQGFLQKPYSPAALAAALEDLLIEPDALPEGPATAG